MLLLTNVSFWKYVGTSCAIVLAVRRRGLRLRFLQPLNSTHESKTNARASRLKHLIEFDAGTFFSEITTFSFVSRAGVWIGALFLVNLRSRSRSGCPTISGQVLSELWRASSLPTTRCVYPSNQRLQNGQNSCKLAVNVLKCVCAFAKQNMYSSQRLVMF